MKRQETPKTLNETIEAYIQWNTDEGSYSEEQLRSIIPEVQSELEGLIRKYGEDWNHLSMERLKQLDEEAKALVEGFLYSNNLTSKQKLDYSNVLTKLILIRYPTRQLQERVNEKENIAKSN